MPFKPFYGNRLGFHTAAHSTINVDYIRVSYLDNKLIREILSAKKTKLYADEFFDNSNEWSVGSKNSKGKVSRGNYEYEGTHDESKASHQVISIDTNRDFEIETLMKIAKGDKLKGNGLLWGIGKKPYRDYGFMFNNNGSYEINTYEKTYNRYVDWTKSKFVKKNAYNKLSVRKVDDTMYFYLNDHFLFSMPFKPFYGDRIGFQVAGHSLIRVD